MKIYWPISGVYPSEILYPNRKPPPGIHIDDVLCMLAREVSLALNSLSICHEDMKGDAHNISKFTHELDLKNRWFRGVTVVWEIATGSAPQIYLKNSSLSKDFLQFKEFLKAARIVHNDDLWPEINENNNRFYMDYIKSLRK